MKDFRVKKSIRIASGQGFWGDLPQAPINQVRQGPIDYLVMDYLAEVTMSIMQKQRMKNPNLGYARDFVDVVDEVLPDIVSKGITIISNGGGVNPQACVEAILARAKAKNISIKVAMVHGDDILDDMDSYIADGHELKNMDDNSPISSVKDQLLSANIYFGARPIVEALKSGAQVIVTGRVTDTGLTLAPMIHEFGWDFEDYDKMSIGTIAGHIIECGAQCSGGNFTDWETVPNMANIGFPIIEAHQDGTFYVTKHDGTGGLVSTMTVKEQLLYEIGNPAEYITPDCVADFTSIHVEQAGKDRVKVFGITGKPETPFYKVSASYNDGFKLSATLTYFWPNAAKKALVGGEILKTRAKDLGLEFTDFRIELVGLNGCNEVPVSEATNESDEVQLRVSVMGKTKAHLDRFGMEIAPLILTGPNAVTGFAGGRPKASEIVAYWPALLKKSACIPKVSIFSI